MAQMADIQRHSLLLSFLIGEFRCTGCPQNCAIFSKVKRAEQKQKEHGISKKRFTLPHYNSNVIIIKVIIAQMIAMSTIVFYRNIIEFA